MNRSSLWRFLFGLTVVLIIIGVVALTSIFIGNESHKLDIISGIAKSGDVFEKTAGLGQHEIVSFIKGSDKRPLRGAKNAIIRNRAERNDGSVIYDVTYETDILGRRTSTIKKNGNIRRSEFAVFFGCSDLFGVGVSTDDTIPSIFGNELSQYFPYNYGFPGTGAHYVNRMLEVTDFNAELSENSGIFVYVMTEGHVPKTLGKILRIIRPEMPKYEVENNKLKYVGTMEKVEPILAQFKKYIGASWVPMFLDDLNKYTYYTDSDKELVCKLLKSASETVRAKYVGSRFIVLMHAILPSTEREIIRRCVVEEKIEYVDVNVEHESRFDSDPVYSHPTRAVNEVAVKGLVDYLKNRVYRE